MRRLALAALAALLTACSAGVGGDWPDPPKGVLADCHALGDRCGGSGWCGATEDDRLTCCPVPLRDGMHCPVSDPAVVECEVDGDCPIQDCHDSAECVAGICSGRVQTVRTYCHNGVCGEDGSCSPCHDDADCDAVNANECAHLFCRGDGTCAATEHVAAGTPCNFTDGICSATGTCDTGAQ